jgi:hypothetical protein
MKKIFWLFRANLRQKESYHELKNLEDFKNNCWDWYLIQGIWFLENNIFDEVVIWRLQPKEIQNDLVFVINEKKFIQRWVQNFNEVFNYSKPDISFFRGGFV